MPDPMTNGTGGPVTPLPRLGFKGPGNRRAYRAVDLLNADYKDLVRVRQGEKRPLLPGWQNHQMTMDEAAALDAARDNIGLRGINFPSIDVDDMDERTARLIQGFVEQRWPGIPIRFGNYPKHLFQFRREAGAEPIGSWVLPIQGAGRRQIEMRGGAGQHVVSGFHPDTRRLYDWVRPLPLLASMLPTLNRAEAVQFFTDLKKYLAQNGIECGPVSGGGGAGGVNGVDRSKVDQESLKAKDPDEMERVMDEMPNDYPDWDTYMRVGYALKSSFRDDPARGLRIYQRWAAKYEGATGPGDVERHWDNYGDGPFEIGADCLYQMAKGRGIRVPVEEFDFIPAAKIDAFSTPPTSPPEEPVAPAGSVNPTDPGGDKSLARFMNHGFDNDSGNAERFAQLHGQNAKYCIERKRWYIWDERKWTLDAGGHRVVQLATETLYEYLRQATHCREGRDDRIQHAVESRSARGIHALIKLAESIPGMAIDAGEFDKDPYLLNFLNGTLDVRTGKLSPHDRRQLITRLVHWDYNPAAECPNFLKFLGFIFADSKEMITYLQRAFGCTMTAGPKEKVFFICHGPSGTGKTTLLMKIRKTFEEYSVIVNVDSLTNKRDQSSSNIQSDLADLNGARFALTSETEQWVHFNEALIKRLVPGQDVMVKYARKYENGIQFLATHVLWFDANFMPAVKNGEGVFQRIREIPFPRVVPDDIKDKGLSEKLDLELEGIASWVAAGAIDWVRRGGLDEPAEVLKAGENYKESQDSVQAWAASCLILDQDGEATFEELHASYKGFCEQNQKSQVEPRELTGRFRKMGLVPKKAKGRSGEWGRGWGGVRIIGDEFDVVDADDDGEFDVAGDGDDGE